MHSAAVTIHHSRCELLRLDQWEGRRPLGQPLTFDRIPGTALVEPIGRLFVIAPLPSGRVWLAGVLGEPRHDGGWWRGQANTAALFDATAWRAELGELAAPGSPRALTSAEAATLEMLARGGGPITQVERVETIVGDILGVIARLREIRPDDPLGQGPDAWEAAFGGHDPKRPAGAPLASDELEAIEAALGCRLPAGYRAYLARVGDGLPRRYSGIASIRDASTTRRFVLDGSWRAPIDPDDDAHDCSDGGCKGLHRELPAGAKPSDGCIQLGVDGNHSSVWLVVNGPAEHTGTIWQDDRNVDFGGFEPTNKDFLVYFYELVHAKLELSSPPPAVNVADLEPAEELRLYASAWYAPLLFAQPDVAAFAREMLERVPADTRTAAASDLRVAAGAALSRALRAPMEPASRPLAATAHDLIEAAWDAVGGPTIRNDRVRHGIGNACDDAETFALVAGRWERAEQLAREGCAHGCTYRDNHAIHLHVARACRGAAPDPAIRLVDPDYDLRSNVLSRFLAALPVDILECVLAAIPSELALGWLTWKMGPGYLIDAPDRIRRLADALEGTLARYGDGLIGRVERSAISQLLFPDRGVRSCLSGLVPADDDQRSLLARAWHAYSLLLCASTRLWDERYVREAIDAARANGLPADWVTEARTELERDELAAWYRERMERVLPRIENAGPTVAKSFRVAVASLSDRARSQLQTLVARVAPRLTPLCEPMPPDDPMRILLRRR